VGWITGIFMECVEGPEWVRLMGSGVVGAAEGVATWLLVWLEDGVLRKEEVRRVVDGSIFEKRGRECEARRMSGRD